MSRVEIQNALAEIKVSYEPKSNIQDCPKVDSPESAVRIARSFWKDIAYRESFYVLLLNRANRIIGYTKISEGGGHATVADAKMIFQAALKTNASSLVLCHNHPSGNDKPSETDLTLTKRLVKAGEFLEIKVIDHIILLPENGFFSFVQGGLMS